MTTWQTAACASADSPTGGGGWRGALADAWALALPFWRDRAQRRAWGLLAGVLGLTLGTVALNVRFSSWNSAFYDALQNHDLPGFWHQLGVFGLLAAAFIVAAVYRQYLQQRLQMRWRVWLTQRLMAQWLRPGSAYRLGSSYRGPPAAAGAQLDQPDNPDQRIAEDVQQFVSGSLTLSLGLLNAAVTLLSFVTILWGLSGAWTLNLDAGKFQLPGAMVWVALAYAGIGSWLAQRIGRPLVPLGVQQQRAEADFRYALVQVRDHAEAIALARAEPAEAERLSQRLAGVRDNWWRLILATKRLTWFSAGYGQLAVVFPLLAAAPRYFAGQMALGGLMQTAQAFGQVQGALSWLVDSYASLADWRATVQRLAGFRAALRDDAGLQTERGPLLPPSRPGLSLELEGLLVQTPAGRNLLELPYAALAQGERVAIAGPSGQGKSALLRTLAGLWPNRYGRIRRAAGQRWMFVPQRPYVPQGTLLQALAWPQPATQLGATEADQALRQVGLAALAGQLDTPADWGRLLSPGEQQRLQFARVLLARPDLLLLDEVCSALEPAAQQALYRLLWHALPHAAVLSVVHQPALEALHGQVWRVVNGGLELQHDTPPAPAPERTAGPHRGPRVKLGEVGQTPLKSDHKRYILDAS